MTYAIRHVNGYFIFPSAHITAFSFHACPPLFSFRRNREAHACHPGFGKNPLLLPRFFALAAPSFKGRWAKTRSAYSQYMLPPATFSVLDRQRMLLSSSFQPLSSTSTTNCKAGRKKKGNEAGRGAVNGVRPGYKYLESSRGIFNASFIGFFQQPRQWKSNSHLCTLTLHLQTPPVRNQTATATTVSINAAMMHPSKHKMGFSDFRDAILIQPPSFKKKKEYVLEELLGRGGFGKVVKALWTPPGGEPKEVALK